MENIIFNKRCNELFDTSIFNITVKSEKIQYWINNAIQNLFYNTNKPFEYTYNNIYSTGWFLNEPLCNYNSPNYLLNVNIPENDYSIKNKYRRNNINNYFNDGENTDDVMKKIQQIEPEQRDIINYDYIEKQYPVKKRNEHYNLNIKSIINTVTNINGTTSVFQPTIEIKELKNIYNDVKIDELERNYPYYQYNAINNKNKMFYDNGKMLFRKDIPIKTIRFNNNVTKI